MNDLQAIASEYEAAEVTVLALFDKKQNKYFSLFTCIELVPAEQERSGYIGTQSQPFVKADINGTDYSLFLGRANDYTTEEGTALFLQSSGGYSFRLGERTSSIALFPNAVVTNEPPGGLPILIDRIETGLNIVLPKRSTSFRVWAKIDKEKKWLYEIDDKLLEKMLNKVGALTSANLGFDISEQQEHLGNIYICASNPILRRYELKLIDHEKKLLVDFKERAGKSIRNCKLLLEENRGDNTGFSVEHTINDQTQVITLPYFPDELVTRLYDQNGRLLDKHNGAWTNFETSINIGDATINLTVTEKKKSSLIKIPKYVKGQSLTVGTYDHSFARYFKAAKEERRYKLLEQNKEFIFFPGVEKDKAAAAQVIKEIIENASKRCMLLDPYFAAKDLIYAFLIRCISFPVQIISSASFLKTVGESGQTLAETLLTAINDYRANYPRQQIDCKVIKGPERGYLHDRYIVSDDKVYLLGSSFNEFGSRATTLTKVPTPQKMIEQALSWWTDPTKTVSLEDFVNNLSAPNV